MKPSRYYVKKSGGGYVVIRDVGGNRYVDSGLLDRQSAIRLAQRRTAELKQEYKERQGRESNA